MPTNEAAWWSTKGVLRFDVKSAPYTSPGPNEIVIENHAIAANIVDGLIPSHGNMAFPWLKAPFIIGNGMCSFAGL